MLQLAEVLPKSFSLLAFLPSLGSLRRNEQVYSVPGYGPSTTPPASPQPPTQ
jgi:hypothetical protein